jgi:predicted Zn-dependent peptidase
MKVWLLERHAVPIVSMSLAVTSGASSDPKGRGGLALATANMLDEGAGSRGALELARAIDDLGATIHTDANADSSFASLTVLKRNLAAAMALYGDVITRPRFEPVEWRRVHDLWMNDLKQRASDPDATARVVFRVALFGPDHPYGHPWDGTTESAKKVTLDDVRVQYLRTWRPDCATLVVVGDVSKEELAPLLDKTFGRWKAPGGPAPAPVVPPAPKGPWPRLVIVDRPDAPQSVIAAVKPGVAASDPDAAVLSRVNDAVGGTFTSRLNQDLREEHGWSYGAHSRVASSRGPGQVVAWASVVTEKTGDALAAMISDLQNIAQKGMNPDEVDKTRSQARSELVSVYESVEGAGAKLGADASLGLPPDHEATASKRRDEAGKDLLDRLAKSYFDPTDAILVIVGPRAKIGPQIDKLGLPAPQMRDADGNVLGMASSR